ncbi:hypothetical protein [Anabaena sp. CCY 9402-a]|uniref:hypothetical protein n=1 Tax=Anabaena sp. CCY 9402-a TaxID=3103867 RepID=UPI0039C5C520
MRQQTLHLQRTYLDSLIIAVLICISIIFFFLQSSEQFLHWFLIPVTLSGIFIGIDAVDWFRGRLNIFDPVGIIGLLGFHFFFLAPLLHVYWNLWMGEDIIPPPDWRPWLGGMAILNFLGLWVYRFFRNLRCQPPQKDSKKTVWIINRQHFFPIICVALIIAAILQVMVYQKFGGIANYIEAATRAAMREGENEFQGMGILFLLSESFPIVSMMGFAVYAQNQKRLQSKTVLIVVLIIFLGLQLFFGGLRGSRSNTIWALFWAVGIIHFLIRKISKKEIAIGLVFFMFFMYIYGFLKTGGLEAINTALEGQEGISSLEEQSGRTWQVLILQDLGRSDIQAFLLYRLMRHDSDYQYAWGRTYLSALTMLIPSAIMPEKLPEKTKEGTEAQYGMGTYHPQLWSSSKVYGLAGETMLNFGPSVIPLAFIVLGLIVGRVRYWFFTLLPEDQRLLLLPMLVNFCFVILVGDTDNYIFFLFKNSGVATLIVFLSSDKKTIKNLP